VCVCVCVCVCICVCVCVCVWQRETETELLWTRDKALCASICACLRVPVSLSVPVCLYGCPSVCACMPVCLCADAPLGKQAETDPDYAKLQRLAEAEAKDNELEQARQRARPIVYGQIVQIRQAAVSPPTAPAPPFSLCLSLCLSVSLSVSLSVCLSVCVHTYTMSVCPDHVGGSQVHCVAVDAY
jgi:hypothetical protein